MKEHTENMSDLTSQTSNICSQTNALLSVLSQMLKSSDSSDGVQCFSFLSKIMLFLLIELTITQPKDGRKEELVLYLVR